MTMYFSPLVILPLLLVAAFVSGDMSFSDIQSPIDVLLYRAAESHT